MNSMYNVMMVRLLGGLAVRLGTPAESLHMATLARGVCKDGKGDCLHNALPYKFGYLCWDSTAVILDADQGTMLGLGFKESTVYTKCILKVLIFLCFHIFMWFR